MITQQTAEILLKAADYVRAGWRQDGLLGYRFDLNDNATPTYCVVGAIRKAKLDLTNVYIEECYTMDEVQAVIDYAGITVDISRWEILKTVTEFGVLPAWNDVRGRTAEEVITVLEQAAANLKAKDES